MPGALTVQASLGNAAFPKWLANAKKTKLETLSIRDWYDFTRDKTGAFTRLDVVIREARYKKVADLPPYVVKDIVGSIRKLPAGSLTHLAAVIDLRGTLVPVPDIVRAGEKAL